MNIMFWAIAFQIYKGPKSSLIESHSDYFEFNDAFSIFFICLISLYTVVRFFYNPLGGMYMAKRVLIVAILAPAFDNNIYLLPLMVLELVFMGLRLVIESP